MTLDLLASLGHEVTWIEPEPATREEVLSVHEEPYVRAVEAVSAGVQVEGLANWGLGTADTPVFPGIDLATRRLVGGTLTAARLVADGQAQRVLQFGGGLHHAHRGRASGFCVYNDLAVAARYLASHGLWVTYLDIDVHHGDGVQAMLYRDDRVQTISLHESGQYLFPGSGALHELGESVGRGLKLNLPLEPFTDTESYLDVFDRVVPAAVESFGPHVLLVQAGADAHFDDPLADLALTTVAYEALFRRILDLAERHTQGRVIFTLGGGYSTRAVPRIWALLYLVVNDLPIPNLIPPAWSERWAGELGGAPMATLHDALDTAPVPPRRDEIARRNQVVAGRLLEALAPFWY
jgi:acetoin utilization protein AcuC